MNTPQSKILPKQLKSVHSISACQKVERKQDAKALAVFIYDVFKEKKRRENGIIIMDQNNAQLNSSD